jgi:hypothetical protein
MNGLTQITINEQAYPVFFGMLALELFTKQVGNLDEDSVLGTAQTAHLVYAGLKNGAVRKGEAFALPFETVYDTVEEKYLTAEGQAELVEISKVFNESKAVKALSERVEEAKKKKN